VLFFYYFCINFSIMINSVRNTVLAIANKQNYGYITPSDFNLYAKQAQLDIFEEYFYRYNQWIVRQNARQSGTEYADIVKNIEEVIDTFSVANNLTFTSPNFDVPSDYYLLNVIRYNNKEIDKVSNAKILNLNASNLTSPSLLYPAYVLNGDKITVYPSQIVSGVSAQYIRRPKDPKWTYVSLSGGEPMFDQSDSLYQDFELPITDEPSLVAKILQYAGISIREADVYNAAVAMENSETQKEG